MDLSLVDSLASRLPLHAPAPEPVDRRLVAVDRLHVHADAEAVADVLQQRDGAELRRVRVTFVPDHDRSVPGDV